MAVRIHDTLLRDTVELVPRDPGKVSIYVCGPTVYDVAHVGHGRTALVFDVIRRYLEWTGLDVDYVSNVTDVEDKIIARAAERGTSEPELAGALRAGVLGRDGPARRATARSTCPTPPTTSTGCSS